MFISNAHLYLWYKNPRCKRFDEKEWCMGEKGSEHKKFINVRIMDCDFWFWHLFEDPASGVKVSLLSFSTYRKDACVPRFTNTKYHVAKDLA